MSGWKRLGIIVSLSGLVLMVGGGFGSDVSSKEPPNSDLNRLILEKVDDIGDTRFLMDNGHTVLHAASALGLSGEAIRTLISAGAPVNYRTPEGNTPLMLASKRGHLETMRILHQAGADIHARNERGLTSLMLAARSCKKPGVSSWLIEHGARLQARSKRKLTALHFAAYSNTSEMVSLLIGRGANPDARAGNGRTPLFAAALRKESAPLRVLIEAGADINVRSDFGLNALQQAAFSGDHPETYQLLLDAGIERGVEVDRRHFRIWRSYMNLEGG